MIERSYVILTPRTVSKGLSGAILSRLLSRAELDLAAAAVLTPDDTFVADFAASCSCDCKTQFVRTSLGPVDGKGRRILACILQGKNAISKTADLLGGFENPDGDGSSIHESFGIILKNDAGEVIFADPAALSGSNAEDTAKGLAALAALATRSPNIVRNTTDCDDDADQTLVILKPENWRRNSIRPGAILDIFTQTGLRLVGCKVHHIPMSAALEFYGPVQGVLREKLAPKIADKARAKLEQEFGITLRDEANSLLNESVGRDFADDQFYQIVEFMSGRRPDKNPPSELNLPGSVKCMVLIFRGLDAVSKVRTVLGPTDPAKAPGGTVRGEFGRDVMVNSAHASDSRESFLRESGLLEVDKNSFAGIASL